MDKPKNMSERIAEREKTNTGRMDTLFIRQVLGISRDRECEMGDLVFELLDAAQLMLQIIGVVNLREVIAASTKIPRNINEAIVIGGMIDANLRKLQKKVIYSSISPSKIPEYQPSKN